MLKNLLLSALMVLFLVACSGKKQGQEKEQSAPSSTSESKSETALEHPGKALFKQHCSVCHQLDGSGVPGMYPPLANSEYVQGDVTWLVSTIVKGLQGPITVNGVEYNNLMPAMAYLTNEEISKILSYVRQEFGNNAGEVSVEQVNKIRKEIEQK